MAHCARIDDVEERDEEREHRRRLGRNHEYPRGCKLNPEAVAEMRKLCAAGVHLSAIAPRFPQVNPLAVRDVLAWRSWRWVEPHLRSICAFMLMRQESQNRHEGSMQSARTRREIKLGLREQPAESCPAPSPLASSPQP